MPPGRDLNTTLGIAVDEVAPGRVSGHISIDDRVRQPFGVVHGGAYAALAETLASVGTFSEVSEEGKIALGMTNQSQFLRSVDDGTIHAEATAIHRGSTVWVWDVKMTDDEDRLCAVCRMTIAVRENRR